ncbi:ricin-type beta-trefoil lectin domain protein [Dactylosporangium cerinum]|uniref:Ricin-type beta-trefoil lectin domain protein n=1 Tax=Dactylosporangium cerinum TaxID=1434730 RepID=A0ABV9VXI5_9ACTN
MPPVLVRPYVRVIANHEIPPAAHPNSAPAANRPVPPLYQPRHSSWTTLLPPVAEPHTHRIQGVHPVHPARVPGHYPTLAWTVLVLTLATTGLALTAGDRAATSSPGTEPVAAEVTAAQAGQLQIAVVPAPGVAALGLAPAPAPIAAGPLIGPAGLCLEAHTGAVQLRRCTGATAQTWTAPADGTLRTAGQCLQPTALRLGLAGCTGGAAQQWDTTRGMLVARSSRQCLTGKGGTQPVLARCTGGTSQRWQLP